MKKYRSIIITWGLITVAYTLWSLFSYYREETVTFHVSGGLFVSGMILFAIGMFSHMSATGLFDGIMYGFKRNRRARLKEIDPDYEEDEEESMEERTARKKAAWGWVLVGALSVVLSFLIALV